MKKHISLIASLLLGAAVIASPSLSFAQTKGNSQGDNNGNHYAYGHSDTPGNSVFGLGHNDPPAPPAKPPVPPAHSNKNDAAGSSTSFFGQLYENFGSWFNGFHNGNQANASTSWNWNRGDNDGDNDGSTTTTSTSTSATNLPPVISGVSSPTILNVGQTGTWTISASDPQNGNLSYKVDWGDNVPLPRLFAALDINPSFVQTSTFTHSYSSPGVYTVTFTVKDSAGLTTTSSVTVNVVTSTSGPVITDVNATSTTLHYATLTWNTNENSDSEVWYSTTSPVDTSVSPQVIHPALVFSHKVVLSGLNPGTTYYAVVGSKDSRDNISTSSETSFITKAPADTSPVITSVTGSSTVTAGIQGTWSVNASDPQNEPLTYNVDWGDTGGIMMALFAAIQQPIYLQSSTFTHTYANPGTYTITVTAKNSSGLSTTATTSVEVTAASTSPVVTIPVISDVTATSASTTATISWNTDQSSDSTVYYSTSTPVVIGADSTDNVTDSTQVTNHNLTLTGLATSTTYYLVVQSSDSAGTATSSENSFTTSSL